MSSISVPNIDVNFEYIILFMAYFLLFFHLFCKWRLVGVLEVMSLLFLQKRSKYLRLLSVS